MNKAIAVIFLSLLTDAAIGQSRNIFPYLMNYDSVNSVGQIIGHYGIQLNQHPELLKISNRISFYYQFQSAFSNLGSAYHEQNNSFLTYNNPGSRLEYDTNPGIYRFLNDSLNFTKGRELPGQFKNKFRSISMEKTLDSDLTYFCSYTPWLLRHYDNPRHLRSNFLMFYFSKDSGSNFSDSIIQFSDSIYDIVFFQPHNDKNKMWMIGRTFYEYHVYLLDGLSCQLISKTPHTELNYHPNIADFNSHSGWVTLTDNENHAYHDLYYRGDTSQSTNCSMLSFYQFDALNGNISLKKQFSERLKYVYAKQLSDYYADNTYYYPIRNYHIEFSPNDSLLYAAPSYDYRQYTNLSLYFAKPYQSTVKSELTQYRWQETGIEKSILQIPDNELDYYTDIELMGDGKIYLSKGRTSEASTTLSQNDNKHLLVRIEKPNLKGNDCSINIHPEMGTNFPKNHDQCAKLPEHYGRFSSLDFEYKLTCDAHATLNLKNDHTDWDTLYWIIENDTILMSGNSVLYQFKDSGTFSVSVLGKHKYGYAQWFTEDVKVSPIYLKPQLHLDTKDSFGCQWHNFTFNLTLQDKNGFKKGSWLKLLDNSSRLIFQDSNIHEGKQSQSFKFTQAGKHQLNFYLYNGYCSDTLPKTFNVIINEAPRPGAFAIPDTGCGSISTLIKTLYPNQVDSIRWKPQNQNSISKTDTDSARFIFSDIGKHNIITEQFGIYGCITRDTVFVRVDQGFNKNYAPKINQVTVTENKELLTQWRREPAALFYKLYRDNVFRKQLQDTVFIDHSVNVDSFTYFYQISAHDKCNQSSGSSLPAKSILLNGSSIPNESANLSWTAYQCEAKSPFNYQVQSLYNINLATVNANTYSYLDDEFAVPGQFQKCYKIVALDSLGNILSNSNEKCFLYKTQFWVPNVFSPNADGHNDTFKPIVYGIRQYKFSVFNCWGEMVFDTNDPDEGWTPQEPVTGVYMYVYSGLTDNGYKYDGGTFLLIR